MLSTTAAWVAVTLFSGAMVYAGAKDATTMTIPNRLVLFLALAYLVLAPAAGISLSTIVASVLAAAVAFLVTFGLFARGWIGGGDAKLIPVVVLWLGQNLALEFVLCASVAGAVLTLIVLQLRNLPLPVRLQRAGWSRCLHRRDTGIPYGVALAPAALWLLPDSHWYTALL